VLPVRTDVGSTALAIASVLLHAGVIFWWMSRPVQIQPLSSAQTVAVELIAVAPPVPEPVPAVAPTEPQAPAPEAVHDEVMQEDEMAVQHSVLKNKVVKKKPPEKKVKQVQQQPLQEPVIPSAAPTPAATTAPAPAPAASITAARYDADYLKNPSPPYPSMSRRLAEEGRVLLRVQVSPTGHVMAIEIKKSSGFTRLDEAARKAVTHWRFSPARQGNTALVSWVEVPIQFSLQK
jgi:protein TonB